jgi:putative ABC transport system ATP-binding protein
VKKESKKSAVIQLKDIYKEFKMDGQVAKVINGISLEVDEGDYLAITGASGSGKSTLMYIVGLLLRPTSGKYLFEDKDVTGLSSNELAAIRNTQIGFVFQQFNLLPRISAWENVALPLIYSGVPQSEQKERAVKALTMLGLADRLDFRPNQLSGGQQQRVAMARALVNNPAILIADEPTGALDSKTTEQILEVFDDLNKKGQTVLVITHEDEVAAHARTHIDLMDGKVISEENHSKQND